MVLSLERRNRMSSEKVQVLLDAAKKLEEEGHLALQKARVIREEAARLQASDVLFGLATNLRKMATEVDKAIQVLFYEKDQQSTEGTTGTPVPDLQAGYANEPYDPDPEPVQDQKPQTEANKVDILDIEFRGTLRISPQ